MASQSAQGTFEMTSWSEEPAPELDGTAKVTVASIGQRFSGAIEAETVADAVMTYAEDGTAEYVGYQRVRGRIGERTGTFVLRSIGGYDGGVARAELTVVEGSGTGELVGLRGTGGSEIGQGSPGAYTLQYEL